MFLWIIVVRTINKKFQFDCIHDNIFNNIFVTDVKSQGIYETYLECYYYLQFIFNL